MKQLVTLSLVGLVLSTAVWATPVTSHLTDFETHALLPNPVFVAEGRIGGAGTFEMDLGQDTSHPATTADYNWQNGRSVRFTLVYDGNSPVVMFSLGDQSLSYVPVGNISDLFIRTRAATQGSSITVNNLHLFDYSGSKHVLGDSSSAAYATGGVDVLRIEGVDGQGFALFGEVTMNWDPGFTPRNSALAFQIKAGSPVPEPATMALMGGGLLALAYRRRHNR